MDQAKYKNRWLAALTLALWTWGNPTYAKSLVRDFEDFFERCRVSVETNSEFDSTGLQRREVPKRHVRDWGITSLQQAWGSPDSGLYVLLTRWTSRDGIERHICSVQLFDNGYVLEPVEQALLLRHFLMHQVELIGAGTHEIDRQLSSIPPIVNAAFLLREKNPNGCIVSNSVAFSPDGKFFSAQSGEKAVTPCETHR